MELMKAFNDKEQFKYQNQYFSFVQKNAYHINFIFEIVQ